MKQKIKRASVKIFFFFLFMNLILVDGLAQQKESIPFLQKADTLNKARFWTCAAAGAVMYSSVSVGLYNAWYKDYPTTRFHTFNDWGEWRHVDKVGHMFTSNWECNIAMESALWTGMNRSASIWAAAGMGFGLQFTIEMMDGFSEKWGFSIGDIGFNTLGVGLFVSQELLWQEQRILMKVSSSPLSYSTELFYSIDGKAQTSLADRAGELYGSTYAENFIKDYNAQVNWASLNIASFMRKKKNSTNFPAWLNIAIGYGANNMFGGFDNKWKDEDEHVFSVDEVTVPRYSQYYLSFDIDMSKIKTKSLLLKTLLKAVNWVKIPAPALEVNTLGEIKLHPVFW